MSFPTEQQVEAVAHALYGLNLDSWEDIVGATRIALTALAPEWREMEIDARRYRWLRGKQTEIVVGTNPGTIDYGGSAVTGTYEEWICGDDMDAAIDAAREREGE